MRLAAMFIMASEEPAQCVMDERRVKGVTKRPTVSATFTEKTGLFVEGESAVTRALRWRRG